MGADKIGPRPAPEPDENQGADFLKCPWDYHYVPAVPYTCDDKLSDTPCPQVQTITNVDGSPLHWQAGGTKAECVKNEKKPKEPEVVAPPPQPPTWKVTVTHTPISSGSMAPPPPKAKSTHKMDWTPCRSDDKNGALCFSTGFDVGYFRDNFLRNSTTFTGLQYGGALNLERKSSNQRGWSQVYSVLGGYASGSLSSIWQDRFDQVSYTPGIETKVDRELVIYTGACPAPGHRDPQDPDSLKCVVPYQESFFTGSVLLTNPGLPNSYLFSQPVDRFMIGLQFLLQKSLFETKRWSGNIAFGPQLKGLVYVPREIPEDPTVKIRAEEDERKKKPMREDIPHMSSERVILSSPDILNSTGGGVALNGVGQINFEYGPLSLAAKAEIGPMWATPFGWGYNFYVGGAATVLLGKKGTPAPRREPLSPPPPPPAVTQVPMPNPSPASPAPSPAPSSPVSGTPPVKVGTYDDRGNPVWPEDSITAPVAATPPRPPKRRSGPPVPPIRTPAFSPTPVLDSSIADPKLCENIPFPRFRTMMKPTIQIDSSTDLQKLNPNLDRQDRTKFYRSVYGYLREQSITGHEFNIAYLEYFGTTETEEVFDGIFGNWLDGLGKNPIVLKEKLEAQYELMGIDQKEIPRLVYKTLLYLGQEYNSDFMQRLMPGVEAYSDVVRFNQELGGLGEVMGHVDVDRKKIFRELLSPVFASAKTQRGKFMNDLADLRNRYPNPALNIAGPTIPPSETYADQWATLAYQLGRDYSASLVGLYHHRKDGSSYLDPQCYSQDEGVLGVSGFPPTLDLSRGKFSPATIDFYQTMNRIHQADEEYERKHPGYLLKDRSHPARPWLVLGGSLAATIITRSPKAGLVVLTGDIAERSHARWEEAKRIYERAHRAYVGGLSNGSSQQRAQEELNRAERNLAIDTVRSVGLLAIPGGRVLTQIKYAAVIGAGAEGLKAVVDPGRKVEASGMLMIAGIGAVEETAGTLVGRAGGEVVKKAGKAVLITFVETARSRLVAREGAKGVVGSLVNVMVEGEKKAQLGEVVSLKGGMVVRLPGGRTVSVTKVGEIKETTLPKLTAEAPPPGSRAGVFKVREADGKETSVVTDTNVASIMSLAEKARKGEVTLTPQEATRVKLLQEKGLIYDPLKPAQTPPSLKVTEKTAAELAAISKERDQVTQTLPVIDPKPSYEGWGATMAHLEFFKVGKAKGDADRRILAQAIHEGHPVATEDNGIINAVVRMGGEIDPGRDLAAYGNLSTYLKYVKKQDYLDVEINGRILRLIPIQPIRPLEQIKGKLH